MKKLTLMLMLLVAATLVFTACDDDKKNDPTYYSISFKVDGVEKSYDSTEILGLIHRKFNIQNTFMRQKGSWPQLFHVTKMFKY